MVRKIKRRGGMITAIGKPLGRAAFVLGESVGRDYLQKTSGKVAKGIYEDKTLATNPGFLMTGIKPLKSPKIQIYNKENTYDSENINPNINLNSGGRTKRKYKRRKTRKNRK